MGRPLHTYIGGNMQLQKSENNTYINFFIDYCMYIFVNTFNFIKK